ASLSRATSRAEWRLLRKPLLYVLQEHRHRRFYFTIRVLWDIRAQFAGKPLRSVIFAPIKGRSHGSDLNDGNIRICLDKLIKEAHPRGGLKLTIVGTASVDDVHGDLVDESFPMLKRGLNYPKAIHERLSCIARIKLPESRAQHTEVRRPAETLHVKRF